MSRLHSAFWWVVAVVLLTSAPAQLVTAAGHTTAPPSDDEGDLKGLIRLAQQGDPGAQYTLGRIYEDGVGVERDYKEALNWYRRAASQSSPEGCARWASSWPSRG